MFDIAFSEVMIIAVIALIVIGPERLPRVARTLGHLFGRMQRYVNEVKADIQREVELDELRKLKQSVEESARSIEASVTQEIDSARQELNAASNEVRSVEALIRDQPAPDRSGEQQGDVSRPSALSVSDAVGSTSPPSTSDGTAGDKPADAAKANTP